ncbi:MAG: hypothetical protein ACT4QC_13745 [Planctomycetaceae bacterium]
MRMFANHLVTFLAFADRSVDLVAACGLAAGVVAYLGSVAWSAVRQAQPRAAGSRTDQTAGVSKPRQ